MKRNARLQRRGFSLIEAAIITVMVALAVPPSVRMLEAASSERADRVMIGLATSYSGAIMEQILADVSVHGLEAIAEPTYITDPITGLLSRLEWVTTPYENRRISATVDISGLVGQDSTVSPNPSENLFRLVTVRIKVPTARGSELTIPLSMMLAEPNP